MYKILVTILLMASTAVFAAEPRVIDGDTVDTGFRPIANLSSLRLRVIGIDTPELHGKCELEKQRAKAAKAFLATALKSGHVEYQFIEWDKYGGRAVGEIFLDGHPVSQLMIDNGHAVKYNGGRKTKNWCE